MKILETVLGLSDNPQAFKCDSIVYKGQLWLVPEWRISPDKQSSIPVRIIRIDHLSHQVLDRARGIDADFVLKSPLPREVFEGTAQAALAQRYYVEECPDIRRPRLPSSDNRHKLLISASSWLRRVGRWTKTLH